MTKQVLKCLWLNFLWLVVVLFLFLVLLLLLLLLLLFLLLVLCCCCCCCCCISICCFCCYYCCCCCCSFYCCCFCFQCLQINKKISFYFQVVWLTGAIMVSCQMHKVVLAWNINSLGNVFHYMKKTLSFREWLNIKNKACPLIKKILSAPYPTHQAIGPPMIYIIIKPSEKTFMFY